LVNQAKKQLRKDLATLLLVLLVLVVVLIVVADDIDNTDTRRSVINS
jgi:hypothetical protein